MILLIPHSTEQPNARPPGIFHRAFYAAIAGAMVGLAVAWVVPIVGIGIHNGIDGETIMWAWDASEVWQVPTAVAGAAVGAVLGITRLSRTVHYSCLLWTVLSALIGMHIGELTRLQREEAQPDVEVYFWNPWPGGTGIKIGAVVGFVLSACLLGLLARAGRQRRQ
jgi:hypothetical protein